MLGYCCFPLVIVIDEVLLFDVISIGKLTKERQNEEAFGANVYML